MNWDWSWGSALLHWKKIQDFVWRGVVRKCNDSSQKAKLERNSRGEKHCSTKTGKQLDSKTGQQPRVSWDLVWACLVFFCLSVRHFVWCFFLVCLLTAFVLWSLQAYLVYPGCIMHQMQLIWFVQSGSQAMTQEQFTLCKSDKSV